VSGQLEGRVAVITGAGRGIGFAAAQVFAREGAKLVVCASSDASVRAAVDSIVASGGEAVGVAGDVADSKHVQSVLAQAKGRFGGLDILYNNAGVGYSATERFGIGMDDTVACSEDSWRRVLDINLTGVFLFCKYGIPLLIERGGGVIINTASIGALRGARNAHAYMASKAGVISLTRSIAVTYGANGIRANTICPGVIDTEMVQSKLLPTEESRMAIAAATPVGRVGLAGDIAQMALFLASDGATFISGQTMVVDGGMTA
jgi:meso-butanediol dehydrogenase / (S,S)-butanediol dehydrogenase / diacetyl reductase